MLGLVMIWAGICVPLALSIVAIAVAFVVATQEPDPFASIRLDQSKPAFPRSFKSGPIAFRSKRISALGRGLDQNLLPTTILEVGPGKHCAPAFRPH